MYFDRKVKRQFLLFFLTDFKIAPVAGEIVATRLQCEEVRLFLYLKYYGTLQRMRASVTKSYTWGPGRVA